MSNTPNTVELERTGHHLRVRLRGELDQGTVPAATDQILQAIDGNSDVELDLRGITLCDSMGIAMIVRVKQHATRHGAGLEIVNPSPILKATLAVCGLTDLLSPPDEP